MRRLMWYLTEESGSIGWGASEALAAAMVCHEQLAREFAKILVSYLREDGNLLEFEPLQQGVLWGLGELAEARPNLLKDIEISTLLPEFLQSPDAGVRGLTARVAGLLQCTEHVERLKEITADSTALRVYQHPWLIDITVGAMASDAVQRIGIKVL